MDTSDFGFWLMIVFFIVGVGGIATGISWACGRDGKPPGRDRAVKALKDRPKEDRK